MAPIGIERDENFVVVLNRIPGGRKRGGAEALLAGAVKAVEPRLASGPLVAPAAGAVRRIVVDDQNVHIWQHAKYFVDQAWQILDLVVGSQSDERAGHGEASIRMIHHGGTEGTEKKMQEESLIAK